MTITVEKSICWGLLIWTFTGVFYLFVIVGTSQVPEPIWKGPGLGQDYICSNIRSTYYCSFFEKAKEYFAYLLAAGIFSIIRVTSLVHDRTPHNILMVIFFTPWIIVPLYSLFFYKSGQMLERQKKTKD